MSSRIRRFLALCLIASAYFGSSPVRAYDAMTPEAQAAAMRRGVNILGYDPIWIDPQKARFKLGYFSTIKSGGFDTVRMNLFGFVHMDGNNLLKPAYLETMDRLIKAALDVHLQVILDEHDYNSCATSVDSCRIRLKAFWTQIASRYKDLPPAVMFEILNEPHKDATPLWNDILAENLAIIRAQNPTRNVIIGAANSNSIDKLRDLALPEGDRHIIVTIHFYEPMRFSHQGASWSPANKETGITWGTPDDLAAVNKRFDQAVAWSAAHHRPIFLGEFGAYDKAPMDSRRAYDSAVARAAEARNWPWAYWQFDSDFVAFDVAHDQWVEPIHSALVPPAK